jgi:hypothetical protein
MVHAKIIYCILTIFALKFKNFTFATLNQNQDNGHF